MAATAGRWSPPRWLAVALVVALGVLAGGALVSVLANLSGGTPGGSASAIPSGPSSAPTGAVSSSPGPSESPIIRDEWSEIKVADSNAYSDVWGIYEGADAILAYGRAGRETVGIWRAIDGESWAAVAVPPEPPVGMGGRIVQVIAGADGLLALGLFGDPEGGEVALAQLYRSPDGEHWDSIATELPEGVSAIAAADGRLIAVGVTGIWLSDDDAESWRASDTANSMSGVVTDITHIGTHWVAVGYAGDIASSTPVVWSSDDGGDSWQRAEIAERGAARRVLLSKDSLVLVFGDINEDAVVWRSNGSGWTQVLLGACCLRAVAETPTGFVAVGLPFSGGETYLKTSQDGVAWDARGTVASRVNGATWTERVGLILATESTTVLLAPSPYP